MMREFKFLLRDRAPLLWIALAFLASLCAVSLGLVEVSDQRAELAELERLDRAERVAYLEEQSDWGSAAYYTFHLTSDPPSDFAFAALGQRDVSSWKHRVRMLALEGQIYETDAANPDFALIGRFDFAFVASPLASLFVILLLFDLKSGERTGGRLELLEASAGETRLWRQRTAWRTGLLWLALSLPLLVGTFMTGASLVTFGVASLAVGLYLAFWAWLTLRGTNTERSGSANLTVMLGVWLLICAVIPTLLSSFIDRAVPVSDGGEIMLTQREAVNDAWDLPKSATYDLFLERHPEWAEYTGWDSRDFEWKWYYAFQQVGIRRPNC